MFERHPFRRLKLTALILAALFPIGCKSRSTQSDNKYGFLPFIKSYQFINLPSGSTIRVCGSSSFDDLKWAIGTWAKEIDRSYTIMQSCTQPDIYSYSSTEEYAQRKCREYNLVGRAYMEYRAYPMELVNCGVTYSKGALLHEVGHMFGLCDQYPGEIERCDFTTLPSTEAIMNGGWTTSERLSEDDVKGIRALAKKFGGQSATGMRLSSGTYSSVPGGISKYTITATDVGSRTSAVRLQVAEKYWIFPCDEGGICKYDETSRIQIASSTSFYYWSSIQKGTPFSLNAGLTDDNSTATDGQGNSASHPTSRISASSDPLPERNQPESFTARNGRLLSCSNGAEKCSEERSQSECLCRFYSTCLGIEVMDYCTK